MSISWLTGEQLYSPAVWAQLVRATNNRRAAIGYAPLTVAGYSSGSLPDYPTSADVSGIRQDIRGLKHFVTQLGSGPVGPRVTSSGTLTWMQAGYASAIAFEALPAVNKTDDFGPWIAAYRRNIDLMERVGFEGGMAGAGQLFDIYYGTPTPFAFPAETDTTSFPFAEVAPTTGAVKVLINSGIGFQYVVSYDPYLGALGREWALDGNIIWDTEEADVEYEWDINSVPTAAQYAAIYLRDPASTPATKYTAPPTPYVQRVWEVTRNISGTDSDSGTDTVTLDSAVKEMDSIALWGFVKMDPGAITEAAYPLGAGYMNLNTAGVTLRLNYQTAPLDEDGGFT